MDTSGPILQVALDFANLSQALRVAEEAVAGGAQWLEAGTPLIKSEGLQAVRELKRRFPEQVIVADMKTMDAGRAEVEMAAQAGASVVAVLGAASDETIVECVEAGRRYDARIMVDLAEVADPPARARRAQELGAAIIGAHLPIDAQMRGEMNLDTLRAVAAAVEIPVAAAGGLNSETAAQAVAAGASIVIVGGAITKAPDAREATAIILRAMQSGEGVATEAFKRGGPEQIREMLEKCEAAQVTDAMHRGGWVEGIRPLFPGARCVGPALTVWTYPGDWAKPVEAIDQAAPGTVLVVDVRGEGPAVWGEEATKSCISRGLAGIVIYGALRDSGAIIELGFPAFCSKVAPAAGDPKGMGMIGVPLKINGVAIRTGDWVIADDDGVVVIPQERAVEIANRSCAVVEREAREKAEIDAGSTLAKVVELQKWEQVGGGGGREGSPHDG
jgi:3-hexulose-6-phosphate synthase/6-phospho-3-hexuloisomerase